MEEGGLEKRKVRWNKMEAGGVEWWRVGWGVMMESGVERGRVDFVSKSKLKNVENIK
jgi:hypothetical protein